MKFLTKWSWTLLALAACLPTGARADQEVYLSTSPNGRYRVVVDQVLDRRVDNHLFFRYPLSLVNTRDARRHFEMMDAGSVLVQETENQTYKVQWDAVRFDWSMDSLKLFVHLETLPDLWRTYFVNVNTGGTADVTADLETALQDKIQFHGWDCQQPTVKLVKWIEPDLAFLELTDICGARRGEENKKLFYQHSSVLFDTTLGKVVSNCMNCSDKSSIHQFEKYYFSTIPTPTPTPEVTPVSQ